MNDEMFMDWSRKIQKALDQIPDIELSNGLELVLTCLLRQSQSPEASLTGLMIQDEFDAFKQGDNINRVRLASLLPTPPFILLRCLRTFAKTDNRKYWQSLAKILTDCFEELTNGGSHNRASAWAKNRSDYEPVYSTDMADSIVEVLNADPNPRIYVVLDSNDCAVNIITVSDLVKLKKGLAIKDCLSNRNLVRFDENTEMEKIYERLWVNNQPRIRQVIIDRIDGKFMGIVTLSEAWKWKNKEAPFD